MMVNLSEETLKEAVTGLKSSIKVSPFKRRPASFEKIYI